MDYIEALIAIKEGKKVRSVHWGPKAYIHKVDDNTLFKSGDIYNFNYELFYAGYNDIQSEWIIAEDESSKYCDKCGSNIA